MRVRFAPSPTGFLHLGGLRTAFFNYMLAKSHLNGTFILRIEDTDQSRTVPGAVEALLETLEWCGIKPDKGPRDGDEYIQSKRLSVYAKYSEHLLTHGLAYKCYCPPRTDRNHVPSRYDRRCRSLPRNYSSDAPFVIRLAADDKKSSLEDLNYGSTSCDPSDDIVLIKSDKFPTYHFANVVDDHEMGIDVVMRGQEWLPSTGTHMSLYRAFQWTPPKFCHLPLLLNKNRTKLSKRQQAAQVDWYRRELHCLPEALLNFVSFLGWTPSVKTENAREVLGMDELISIFSVNDLNKSDAIVDVDRLRWFNRQHLQMMPTSNLAEQVRKELKELHSLEYIQSVVDLMRFRIESVHDLITTHKYFFTDPFVESDKHSPFITNLIGKLENCAFDSASIRIVLDQCRSLCKQEHGQNLAFLRTLLTGQCSGVPIADLMSVLGKTTVLRRLYCLNKSV